MGANVLGLTGGLLSFFSDMLDLFPLALSDNDTILHFLRLPSLGANHGASSGIIGAATGGTISDSDAFNEAEFDLLLQHSSNGEFSLSQWGDAVNFFAGRRYDEANTLCPAVPDFAGCNEWASNSVNVMSGADFPAIKDQAACRSKCALDADCTSYILHPQQGCALYKTLDGCTGNHGWTGYQMNCGVDIEWRKNPFSWVALTFEYAAVMLIFGRSDQSITVDAVTKLWKEAKIPVGFVPAENNGRSVDWTDVEALVEFMDIEVHPDAMATMETMDIEFFQTIATNTCGDGWNHCRGSIIRGITATSDSYGFNGEAYKAVDGNSNNGVYVDSPSGVCAHTQGGNSWITLDLHSSHEIDHMEFVGRRGSCAGCYLQSSGWDIHIGNSGTSADPLCKSSVDVSGGDVSTVTCDSALTGQYITITSSNAMVLCEVDVYGRRNMQTEEVTVVGGVDPDFVDVTIPDGPDGAPDNTPSVAGGADGSTSNANVAAGTAAGPGVPEIDSGNRLRRLLKDLSKRRLLQSSSQDSAGAGFHEDNPWMTNYIAQYANYGNMNGYHMPFYGGGQLTQVPYHMYPYMMMHGYGPSLVDPDVMEQQMRFMYYPAYLYGASSYGQHYTAPSPYYHP